MFPDTTRWLQSQQLPASKHNTDWLSDSTLKEFQPIRPHFYVGQIHRKNKRRMIGMPCSVLQVRRCASCLLLLVWLSPPLALSSSPSSASGLITSQQTVQGTGVLSWWDNSLLSTLFVILSNRLARTYFSESWNIINISPLTSDCHVFRSNRLRYY